MSYKFKYGSKEIMIPTSEEMKNHSHAWGNITSKPSTYPPSSHNQDWGTITGKPSTFTPINHSHNYATWLGFQYASGGEWFSFYNGYGGTRKGWIGHDGTNHFQIKNEAGEGVELTTNGKGVGLYIAGSSSALRSFVSNTDTINLGLSSARWLAVYAKSGAVSTSDETKKKNISSLNDKYYKLAEMIEIVSFQFKETEQEDKIGRTHIGAISQRVEKALCDVGLTSKDFAGFCKDQKNKVSYDENEHEVMEEIEGEYDYSLRYDELSMLKIWYLEEKSKKQDEEIKSLKNDLRKLKEMIL